MPDLPAEVGHVAAQVDDRLERLLETERSRWAALDPRLAEAVDELGRMAGGGKRLRAAFCYHAWAGLGGDDADRAAAVDVATAFELLQTFALIHDDVMDAADTRRGEQTIHLRQGERMMAEAWRGEPRRYGEGVAVLIGDLAHVYADRLVGMHGSAVRDLWDELRIELNLGQYLDMRSAAAGELDRATAAKVALFKSALYTIVRPLQVGAALAKGTTDHPMHELFERFGSPLGRAFQLRDDVLGVLGDTGRTGKPVGDDLREGKATELVAVALDRANPAQQKVLETIGDPEMGPHEVAEILAVLQATGAIDDVEGQIVELVAEATAVLAEPGVPEPLRTTLAVLADYVASRTR